MAQPILLALILCIRPMCPVHYALTCNISVLLKANDYFFESFGWGTTSYL